MIKCLVIDDEKLAIELMEDNIRQVSFLQHVASCRNAQEASRILEAESIDLLFLDIQMPGLSGLQFLGEMKVRPMVILVTAYEQYALQGFNLDVLDYLLKPVPFERFFKAVNKAYQQYQLRNGSKMVAPSEQEYLFVNADYSLVRIDIPKILYVEGLKDYVKIYIEEEERPVIARLSMRFMEEKLPANQFIRIHRSYIVSLHRIKSYKKNRVFINTVEIPVSEAGREALLIYMGQSSD